MLSQFSKDTIRVAIHIANEQSNEYIRIREISDQIGISYHTLSKVAQNLAKAGILDSYSGPNGGFRLNQSPSEIYLIDVLNAVDEEQSFESCLLGFSDCGEGNPCPLHNHWKIAKLEIKNIFSERTIAEFIGSEDQLLQCS